MATPAGKGFQYFGLRPFRVVVRQPAAVHRPESVDDVDFVAAAMPEHPAAVSRLFGVQPAEAAVGLICKIHIHTTNIGIFHECGAGVLPSCLLGAGETAFWRRGEKRVRTCAIGECRPPFCGAGPSAKNTPAPKREGTCAKKRRDLRQDGLPAPPGGSRCGSPPLEVAFCDLKFGQ